MKFLLDLPEEINNKIFVQQYIIPKLLEYIKLNLNEDKIVSLDNYLKREYEIETSSMNLLEYAIKNLFISKTPKSCVIMIDENIYLKDLKNQKLSSIIKLIEYGNLDIRGTMIIHKAFTFIKDNLEYIIYG